MIRFEKYIKSSYALTSMEFSSNISAKNSPNIRYGFKCLFYEIFGKPDTQ